jgi:hypothetical protein
VQPHEYERGGTAKLLTLFRPATGLLRAKGVLSASNAVLHPWLKAQLSEVLAEIEKAHPRAELPPEDERPPNARWETWLGHRPRTLLPPLRVVLVLDNLAGHLSYDLVGWFFAQGVMPLYTPIGGRLSQHGRVGAAHHCATRFGRTPSQECARSDRLVRTNRGRLEQAPHAFRLEWQAQKAARTGTTALLSWLRRGIG